MRFLIITRQEVERLLASRRGWLAMAGFALVWLVVLVYAIRPVAQLLELPEARAALDWLLGRVNPDLLSDWPVPALAVYWVSALYLLPAFTILLCADQFASDRQRGTLRYIVMRASRVELFLGRFAGQMLIQASLVLLTVISVLVLLLVNGVEPASWLSSVPVVIANLCVVLMPYVALMSCLSMVAKTARQATLFAVILWILVWIVGGWVQVRWPGLVLADLVLPGGQISQLLGLGGWNTVTIWPVPLAQTLVLLVLGVWGFRRLDL